VRVFAHDRIDDRNHDKRVEQWKQQGERIVPGGKIQGDCDRRIEAAGQGQKPQVALSVLVPDRTAIGRGCHELHDHRLA
jgi:hypothetical protein